MAWSRTTSKLPRVDLSGGEAARDLSEWTRGQLRVACLREGIDHAGASVRRMRKLLHVRDPRTYPWSEVS